MFLSNLKFKRGLSLSMDHLPPPLVLEILSRLNDSADLARCRLVSKTLDILSREVRSVHLQCSLERYLRSRCPNPVPFPPITPFKTVFLTLISNLTVIESVSIGIEKLLRDVSYDDVEDESDDLFLTDGNFVNQWLPKVSGRLKCLSISDFWVQSCWRRSTLLPLVSSYCHSLLKLEVKNAWLSVDGLNPMPKLTSLTLEFIRLDDEDLDMVNSCFPSLQVLNLIGVGGLKEPNIHLMNLKSCHWTVSNAPWSLTLIAPNLVTLKLECVRPWALVIEAPLLSHFDLAIQMAVKFEVKEFCSLKTFWLESSYLRDILDNISFGRTVKYLTVDSQKLGRPVEKSKFSLEELFNVFPSVSSLTLGSGAWSELEASDPAIGSEARGERKGLKEITAYLVLVDPETALSSLSSVLESCSNLSDVALLIHRDVVSTVSRNFMSRSMAHFPRVRWRWGMWKEGMKDAWISDGI